VSRVTGRQIIWLGAGSVSFTAICEECLADPDDPDDGLAYRLAKVQGSLRAEADVGFTRCRRGHRLSVRRGTRGPPVARSAALD
jgi:hypothetical protein